MEEGHCVCVSCETEYKVELIYSDECEEGGDNYCPYCGEPHEQEDFED